jgi:hypothetical protein
VPNPTNAHASRVPRYYTATICALNQTPLHAQDHDQLYEEGVAAIYGPGTRIPAAALDMLHMLMDTDTTEGETSGAEATAASAASSGKERV